MGTSPTRTVTVCLRGTAAGKAGSRVLDVSFETPTPDAGRGTAGRWYPEVRSGSSAPPGAAPSGTGAEAARNQAGRCVLQNRSKRRSRSRRWRAISSSNASRWATSAVFTQRRVIRGWRRLSSGRRSVGAVWRVDISGSSLHARGLCVPTGIHRAFHGFSTAFPLENDVFPPLTTTSCIARPRPPQDVVVGGELRIGQRTCPPGSHGPPGSGWRSVRFRGQERSRFPPEGGPPEARSGRAGRAGRAGRREARQPHSL